MPEQPMHDGQHASSVVETVQQLLVAFVLAMTFRGFVAEGFVIPTGSMAPTLMGQHLRVRSDMTGYEFPIGLNQEALRTQLQSPPRQFYDPMLGRHMNGIAAPSAAERSEIRMGDRIFVLKSLYPFNQPDRFDVVVFKNPTDPNGDSQNYIKRLIGLPDETIWLADGDVFARHDGESEFRVQRKPEHVQRAVWQPVYDSRYTPFDTDRVREFGRYQGGPWQSVSWSHLDDGSMQTSITEETVLEWDHRTLPIDDGTPYNMLDPRWLGRTQPQLPVSDIRVAAGLVRDAPALQTTLHLSTREFEFEFILRETEAEVRMRQADIADAPWDSRVAPVSLPDAGDVIDLEFWHVDQTMNIYLDGQAVFERALAYEWDPETRIRRTVRRADNRDSIDDMTIAQIVRAQSSPERQRIVTTQPQLRWSFAGSPVTLHQIRVDRDLHYRVDLAKQHGPVRLPGGMRETYGFGTHPDSLATLGPDHFMMLGDNSAASLDSRKWGLPDDLVAFQVDDAPYVVNRKLLIGKAWVVYFPSPIALSPGGKKIIPDFGRLRFIR